MSQKRNINWSVSDAKLREKIPQLESMLKGNSLYKPLSSRLSKITFSEENHCIFVELDISERTPKIFDELQTNAGRLADAQGLDVISGYTHALLPMEIISYKYENNLREGEVKELHGYRFSLKPEQLEFKTSPNQSS